MDEDAHLAGRPRTWHAGLLPSQQTICKTHNGAFTDIFLFSCRGAVCSKMSAWLIAAIYNVNAHWPAAVNDKASSQADSAACRPHKQHTCCGWPCLTLSLNTCLKHSQERQ